MVSSKTRKTISLAISLLVVVISLTGTALAASAPTVSTLGRYNPGFGGAPGKIAADPAGNLYVADFWAKGIVKLDRQGNRIGFIPTTSRPAAVAVMPDNRLVVAMSAPTAKVAFYVQSGVTGEESTVLTQTYCRPSAVTIDGSGNIYVLDAGDYGYVNVPRVRVYNSAGTYQGMFGARNTNPGEISTVGGQFNQPLGIAYEKANNQIVVVDSMNARLQFFTPWNGASTYVKSLGLPAIRSYGVPAEGSGVVFGGPADVAFEYAGSSLNRIYVVDRSRHQVDVVDPVTTATVPIGTATSNTLLKMINGSLVTNGALFTPSGVLFQNTATGGVLYVTSGATTASADNNVTLFSVDGGAVPAPAVTLKITSSVPPTTTATSLIVSGTVSPVASVYCSVNGSVTETLATPSGGNWSINPGLTLQNGFNYILCKASDGTATAYAEANIYSTATPGNAITTTIDSPVAGFFTGDATVVITGTASAANANIKLVNVKNGDTVTALAGTDGKWSAAITLGEGANDITVTSWKTGTDSGSTSLTVNADFTPPTMNVSFLNTGATTVNAVQNVDGIVVEKNLSKIRVNGVDVTATVALAAADSTYFSAPVVLERGSNTVNIEVTDLANHVTSVTRTVTLNPEIPGLAVALPADNSFATGAGTTSANGTADSAFTNVTLSCGNVSLTPSSGNWSTAVMAVASGMNSCQFTASGGGNVAVAEKRTINADSAYVKVAITSPAADLATNSPSVIIAGTVATGSPTPTLSVTNGTAVGTISYNSGTGAFSQTVNLGLEGLITTVKVVANGSTTAIRNILYDVTAPVLSIQANANAAPSLLTGTIEPSAKLATIVTSLSGVETPLPLSRITFDNYDPATGAAVWHANLSGYAFDALTVTTVDPAGNQTAHLFVNGIPTGDVDGDGVVRLSDAMACLRHVAGTEVLPGSPSDKNSPRFQADVGGLVDGYAAQDGDITVDDALLILQKSYGLKSF